MQIPQEHVFSAFVGDKEVIIKAGKLAQQAGAAVTAQMGDTMLLCTATMNPVARPGTDFLPLSVDFEERLYAAGRIPGSFMRREGRPSERGILTSRVTDRALRPLFPKHMHNDVQVIVLSLAHDRIHDVDMLSIIASSAALMISDIPWAGPLAGVRIGLINGELVVNPTIPEMEKSILDLRVAGSADAIIMVECTANEVPEDTMLAALNLAHDSIQEVLALQVEMQKTIGKMKVEIPEEEAADDAMRHQVLAKISEDVAKIVATKTDRDERQVALDDLHERIISDFTDEEAEAAAKTVRDAISDLIRDEVRRRIVEDGVRPDGRNLVQLRPIWAEVDVVPRVHGSGIFNRGQTQVLGICTLGTPADSQLLDGLHPEDDKRYMHHYNFPPYSTGETSPLRGPKRREIGHGALAENALLAVLPSEEDFPYTIRVVSEVLSSNGSSSMASVCASTLALMDAGVPLREAVAGIAMGLIKEGDNYIVLTDIQGLEDHLGDMDFKVAGTRNGINALQMDIKIKGVPSSVMEQALNQAYNARIEILGIMAEAIPAPRPQLNPNAPRMEIVQIEVDKIGALIGPGGKNIRAIQESTGTKIEIREDGKVFIAGPDGTSTQRAIDRISGLTETPQPGKVYTGKISRIEDYGVFVELMPGMDGLVHISQLADYKIMNIREEFSIGDEIMVMIIDVDPAGKVRLSRQAVIEGWTLEEAREKDKGGKRGGGGGDRGGDRRGGGGGDRRGGGGGNYRGGGDRGGERSGGGDRPAGGERSGGGDRGPRRFED